MKRKAWSRLTVPLLAASLLAGCSLGISEDGKEKEPAKIRVMYWEEASFHQQYGMLFSAIHPNIEVEVVQTQGIQPKPGEDYEKLMLDFIEKEKPDVLMLNPNQYTKLADEGKLLDLESRVNREEFDFPGLVPGMVEYLKEKGGGKLYGLSPSYASNAIYYNKDLFDKYGVDLPTDKMSWDQLLTLAQRFPTDGDKDKRVYGLKPGYHTNLHQLATGIGSTQGLKYVDPVAGKVMIDSESWAKVFDTALKAIKSGALYMEEHNFMGGSFEEYLLQNPFVGGRVAMTIDGPGLAGQIKQAATSAAKDKAVKNWDLVTVPVDPQNPDFGNSFSFYNIFAIDAASPNIDAAWEFIDYIHSDEFARVTSKSNNWNAPIRTKYFKDDAGHRFEAFYALKPSPNDPYKDFNKLPQDFYMQWDTLASQELKEVEDGKKTVAEALASLQTKAQAALISAKEKEGANPPAASGTDSGSDAGSEESGVKTEAATTVERVG